MGVRIQNPTDGPGLLEPDAPGAARLVRLTAPMGALRRSVLAALHAGDVAVVARELQLWVARGKTDRAGQGAEAGRRRGRKIATCLVRAACTSAGSWTARERHMLARLLSEPPAATMPSQAVLRRCSAWTSAFTAMLGLANQSDAGLAHEGALGMIDVYAGTAANRRLADIQRTLDNSVDG